MRRRCASALAVAAGALAALTPPGAHASEDRAAVFAGLAAWIDVYDAGPWERPESTARRLAARGVRTVLVQTANHRRRDLVHRRSALTRLVTTAHARGMRVVAWTLPGLRDPGRDWRQAQAALDFRAGGRGFDGFALDIESTLVRDVAARNRRLLALLSRLDAAAARGGVPLGAIVPDPAVQRYWPRFPHPAVARHVDALVPMAYWTGFARGEAGARAHVCRGLRVLRARTGDAAVPIHAAGGIADRATVAEVRGLRRAAQECGAIGASLYDAPITSEAQWRALAPLGAGFGPAPAAF